MTQQERNRLIVLRKARDRVGRGFGTDQDQLVKGLRVAGIATLEAANAAYAGATPDQHAKTNRAFLAAPSEQDISNWLAMEHFYLALTGGLLVCLSARRLVKS